MHVAQIILVEAESEEDALAKVTSYIIEAEEPNPDWSDWSEIGGRWAGTFAGKNVLCYDSDSELAEATIKNFLDHRLGTITAYYTAASRNLDLAEMVGNYNPEAEHRGHDPIYAQKQYEVYKLMQLLMDWWAQDSGVYDLEWGTTNLKAFRERVAVAPEMQYLVVVDFHF